jgi:hypothetical protein
MCSFNLPATSPQKGLWRGFPEIVHIALRQRARAQATGAQMKNLTLAAGLALSIVLFPGASLAEDLQFMLTNASSYDLMVFQTSPSGVESWEEDVLADAYLPSGNQVPITIADGRDVCIYDMRYQFDGADPLELFEVDLCELDGGEYTLSDAD